MTTDLADLFALPLSSERHLPIMGTRNLRDVGGYPTQNGRTTRWRTLLRSDGLGDLPEAAQRALIDRGVRTVVDLRSQAEIAERPNVFERSPVVRYRHVPVFDVDPSPPGATLGDIYRLFVDQHRRQLSAAVAALAEPDALPAIVNCAAGKDRTGLVIALVLRAAGVAAETIARDYGLTSHCYTVRWVEQAGSEGGATIVATPDEDPPLLICPPELMLETLEHIETRYGGASGYLQGGGVRPDALDALTERLTEPAG